jgi:hypothetical protein
MTTNDRHSAEHTLVPPVAPRYAVLWAALAYAVVVLALAWPVFGGGFLVSPHSDQYIAGFAFRQFGADVLRETGTYAQWNPYLFGGMPFVAAMHGDLFYPTFLLRMILPTDLAMSWGLIIHVWLAGVGTYLFLRAWGFGFFASLTGGMAYMLGGNVAGLVSPGHDGKLFVSSLLPFTLLLLLRGVRDGRRWTWGVLAIVVGLAVLSPHPQLLQYMLLLGGAFALLLAFADTGGGRLPRAVALRRLAFGGGSVIVGGMIGAIQYLPVMQYVPFSPRAGGAGWEHAISYSMPPEEMVNMLLPQFTGMLDAYWGRNGIHLHSEYIGVVVLMLAGLAFGGALMIRAQRRWVMFWTGAFIVSLLWALGGYTPFYHLVYAVVPGAKFFRAPSTMLFVVSFCVAMLAAVGAERALRGQVRARPLLIWVCVAIGIAVLGVTGGLTNLAQSVASPGAVDFVLDNNAALAAGALRVLLFVVLAAGAMYAASLGRLTPGLIGTLLVALVAADLWSVVQRYWLFSPPAAELFASDATIDYVKAQPQPGRVLAVPGPGPMTPRDPYLTGDALMVHEVRQVLGYHGNELGRFDQLGGRANNWIQIANPNFWHLMNVQYLLVNARESPIPGAELVAGPVRNAVGTEVSLFRLPGDNPYAWLTTTILNAPDQQVIGTILDPRFDVRTVALFDTSATVKGASLQQLPAPLDVGATVTSYAPGRVSRTLSSPAPAGSALLVSENWYPGWTATADGQPVTVERADFTLLGIPMPQGATRVELSFDSAPYHTGKRVTLFALLLAVVASLAGLVRLPRRAEVSHG